MKPRDSASEIIPETLREQTRLATTFALLAGFLVMMLRDIGRGRAAAAPGTETGSVPPAAVTRRRARPRAGAR